MTTDVQPHANPRKYFADTTQDGKEALAISATYMSNTAFHLIMQHIKDFSR